MIQVKICGITNKKEIEYLNILKPEYIGFVFTKSKRQVTGNQANELSSNLNKEIKKVGVFRDNSIDEILTILNKVDLDVIQLHGREDEEFISLLKKTINKYIKIWKVISIKDIKSLKEYIKSNKQVAVIDNFLIDGDNPGSGEAFSLEDISEYFDKTGEESYVEEKYNFFLAGGITAENVTQRIAKAKPIGIDVSSGVEIIDENGIRTKSFEKMRSLIEQVKSGYN